MEVLTECDAGDGRTGDHNISKDNINAAIIILTVITMSIPNDGNINSNAFGNDDHLKNDRIGKRVIVLVQ